jgi:molybdate transport system ATP-binding protein
MDLLTIDITLPRRSFDLRAQLNLGSETIALVGPSGSGKTSLLRAIAGLEPSTMGRIALRAEAWLDSSGGLHLSPEHRRVGYLPQDYGLFPHMTVAANVRFASRRERPDLLERLHIAHLAAARPRQLSGGERQRVALARALAREPEVLLLDEPFASLDTVTRRHVRDELADILAELALPTLVVSHAFADAIVLAGRTGVLDQGQLVQLAPAPELQRSPATATVAELTGANVLTGTATPIASGSHVLLDGGGELHSDQPASGVVRVAVQPWAFTLTEPDASPLTDRVVDVRHDRGTLVIRLTRLTVHLRDSDNGEVVVAEDAIVGLRAEPHHVRVLAPDLSAPLIDG